MFLLATLVLLLATATAPSLARADGGPSPGVSGDGKQGVTDGRSRATYTALDGTTDTFVVEHDPHGRELRSAVVAGSWGIPFVTWDLTPGGLSHDGSRLVLAAPGGPRLARRSRLLVLDARTLRPVRRIELRGDFAFDAISPDHGTLFLIQHSSAQDLQRYRVRAFDLVQGSLEPGAIVDKSEPNMAGVPIRRLVGPGARWVYTLYARGTKYFVHALDTVHAQARCLDVEWKGNPSALANSSLALQGRRLAVLGADGRTLTSIPLPSAHRSRSWAGAGATAAGSLAALAAAGLLVRLRRRPQSP